jgi:AMMECR1 domain-containing protein
MPRTPVVAFRPASWEVYRALEAAAAKAGMSPNKLAQQILTEYFTAPAAKNGIKGGWTQPQVADEEPEDPQAWLRRYRKS